MEIGKGLWKFIDPKSPNYGQFVEEPEFPGYSEGHSASAAWNPDEDENENKHDTVPRSATDLSSDGLKSWRED